MSRPLNRPFVAASILLLVLTGSLDVAASVTGAASASSTDSAKIRLQLN